MSLKLKSDEAGFTLVDAKADKLLRRYGLSVEDVWAGSQGLRHKMERQSVPGSLSKTFERNQKQIAKMLTELGRQIQKLDPTLKGTVARARKRIEYHIDKLRRKAGAIDFQERSVAAWTKFMNQACKVILAAAALARDQERSGSDRDFLREFKKTL